MTTKIILIILTLCCIIIFSMIGGITLYEKYALPNKIAEYEESRSNISVTIKFPKNEKELLRMRAGNLLEKAMLDDVLKNKELYFSRKGEKQ